VQFVTQVRSGSLMVFAESSGRGGIKIMKKILAVWLCSWCAIGFAQTAEELLNIEALWSYVVAGEKEK
jgi:hypothetical protein